MLVYNGDKRMEELKQKLVYLCNESGLPLEAIYFVVKDLFRDVDETLRKAQEAQPKEEKKDEDTNRG